MMKLVTLAAATAALAMPAMAGTMTINFANDDGSAVMITLDDSTMTASVEGVEGSEHPYTWDAGTNTLCGDPTGEGEVCATFTDASGTPAVGDTSTYTSTDGNSGTATITAISE